MGLVTLAVVLLKMATDAQIYCCPAYDVMCSDSGEAEHR